MARRPDNPRPGLVVIDKPQGITSHDAVSRVRRTARTRKAGHAGTLDPMATGVLVVGIGKATKLLTWVSGDTKSYEATIRFGASTRTDDAEGETTSAPGCSHLDAVALGAAFERLRGDIMQVPSAVSAIKVGGRRAYARVRAGEEVELEARPVRVERLDVVGAPRPGALPAHDGGGGGVPVFDVDVVVECSSGTYIRALARDAGTALGCGAHLVRLRRTRVGRFGIGDALTLEQFEAGACGDPERPTVPLIPLGEAARAMFPVIGLDAREAAAFAHGQAPARAALPDGEGPLTAAAPDGRVVGLVGRSGDRLRALAVFAGPGAEGTAEEGAAQ